jgi:hypothetical protein
MKTRSMRQGIEEGTLFEVHNAQGRQAGLFPAAETIDEAVTFALRRAFVREGEPITVWRHLPGSRIGVQVLEKAWAGPARASPGVPPTPELRPGVL